MQPSASAYVVCYKPRKPKPPQADPAGHTYISYTEQAGKSSEFCREGYGVIGEEKIEPAEVERIFELLQQAAVPALCPVNMGCDGKTFELFWSDHFGGASFKWWVEPPAQWKPLKQAADALQKHIVFWGLD